VQFGIPTDELFDRIQGKREGGFNAASLEGVDVRSESVVIQKNF
jgi:hypothetical protein